MKSPHRVEKEKQNGQIDSERKRDNKAVEKNERNYLKLNSQSESTPVIPLQKIFKTTIVRRQSDFPKPDPSKSRYRKKQKEMDILWQAIHKNKGKMPPRKTRVWLAQ